VSAPIACRFFGKSKLATTKISSKNPQESKRLGKAFDEIFAKFPQPEFQEIAREIYARFSQAYYDPKGELKKPALMYVLNSLPGSGKTYFVSEIAKALGVLDSDRYKVYELKPADLYLNFDHIRKFAVTAQDAAEVQAGKKLVSPLVLLYDEYTLAGTLAGSGNNDVMAALAELKERLFNESAAGKLEVIKQTYSAIEKAFWNRNTTDNDYIRQILQQKNEIETLYDTAVAKLANIQSSEGDARTEREQLKKLSDENFAIFWAALGNGVLPRPGGGNNDEIKKTLQAYVDGISKLSSRSIVLNAKKSILQSQKIKLEVQLQDQANRELELGRPPRNAKAKGEGETLGLDGGLDGDAQTSVALASIQRNIDLVSTQIRSIDSDLDDVRSSLEVNFERVEPTMDRIAASMNVSPAQVAEAIGTSLEITQGDAFKEAVRSVASEVGMDLDEVLQTVRDQQVAFTEAVGQLPAGKSLLALYKKRPQDFTNYYKDVLSLQAGEGERWAGNTVIFFAGNVLDVQARIVNTLAEQGLNLCDKIQSELPYFQDPDCLRLVTERVLKEPESTAEMKKSIERVLGQNEQLGANTIMGTNNLATESRIGPIRFIKPMGSADYKTFIRRDLDVLTAQFKSTVKVPLFFEDSVVDGFLFPKFVNAQFGLRKVVDKSRNFFAFTIDAQVAGKVLAYNKAVAALDRPQCSNQEKYQKIVSQLFPTTTVQELDRKKIVALQVRFEKNQTKNGSMYVLAQTADGKWVIIHQFQDLSLSGENLPEVKLSDMDRLTYAGYIGALYGSMAALYRTIPTEPISLVTGPNGVPIAASQQQPSGYDQSAFRKDLLLFNIEIQANIAAIAGFANLLPGYQPPPELLGRKAMVLGYIGQLWTELLKYEEIGPGALEQLLARDMNNDVAKDSLAKADPILSHFSRLKSQGKRDRDLTLAEKDQIYTAVFQHFLKIFTDEPAYVGIMEKLQTMIQHHLFEAARNGEDAKSIDPEVIAGLLTGAGVDLIAEPGAPGLNRCPAYLQAFGVEIPVGVPGPLEPVQEARAKGFFGGIVKRASDDWQKTLSFVQGNRERSLR
jgi:hypothetical protein